MYKVILIDDEPIIVEGLTKVIAWETYDCVVAGTAGDGREGLEVIREAKPDIIITDISMPGMDGLAMLAGLKSEFPDMEVCILTGYREFEYAQRAISLGVTRFLLKPSNMGQIEEALDVMTGNLKKKNITASDDKEQKGGDNASSFIVKNALEYIDNNYTRKLTLIEVAEKTYVSQWHLSKLLNKYTGKSFSELLNQARIKRAKELLEDPALRIGDVAERVGFFDMAHFSRVFKKQTGVSANEYRNTKLG